MPPVSKQTPLPTKATGFDLDLALVLGAFAAAPAHDDGAALARRSLPDPEKRPHAELAHGGVVEDGHLDAILFQRHGAIGELFRVEDIGWFIDQRAGGQHPGRHGFASLEPPADGGRLIDPNKNFGVPFTSSSSFFLVL